ncbi:MAG: hypothetical protein J3Q66DRAFT_346964 [Benniella sp.]|nr:MAG: hypothetical protein J3Q66DRAFT_346964 [Benniella sp.]
MEYSKTSGSSSSSSSRNYPPMPVVDTTIIERLRQAQLEARQNHCVPGLLTDPLLVTVLESLMGFVQAASQSQWCPNSPGVAQRASVRTFPSTIPLEQPRMQGSTRINEPTATAPRPIARAVTNPIPASASASASASTSASALVSASVPVTSRGKEPKHSYHSQSETEARTKKSSKKKKRRRNHKQGSSDERPLYPFNEDARSIPDVWKEWTVGWKGGPALKDLVGAGMAFDRKNYGKHYRMTRAKKTIAEAIEDAVAKGILTLDQAIINMEKYRGPRHPWTIVQKPDFDNWITGEPPVDGRSAEARRKKKEKEGAVASKKNRNYTPIEEVDESEDEGEDESDGDASYIDSEDESYDEGEEQDDYEGEEQDDDEGEGQDVDEGEVQDGDEGQYGDERVGTEQEGSRHGSELHEDYEDPTDLHETDAGDPNSVIVISDEDTAMDGPARNSSPLRFYQKQEPVSATFPGAYSRVSDRGYYRDGQCSSLFTWRDSENVLPDDET